MTEQKIEYQTLIKSPEKETLPRQMVEEITIISKQESSSTLLSGSINDDDFLSF
jgi:hypothetical protein